MLQAHLLKHLLSVVLCCVLKFSKIIRFDWGFPLANRGGWSLKVSGRSLPMTIILAITAINGPVNY